MCMKTLVEQLRESNYNQPYLYNIEKRIEEAEEYFTTIPSSILYRLERGEEVDYVLENLNTHDTDKLISKLKEKFHDFISSIYKAKESEGLKKGGIVVWHAASEGIPDEFYDVLDFYGYYLSMMHITKERKEKLLICPDKADRADDVARENHWQFYHFTKKENVDSILNRGLSIKKSRGGTYREFPERIYLYSTYKKIEDIDDVENFMRTVTGINDIKDIAIIKVDLSRHHLPVYHDDGMEDRNAVYCYNNIPSSLLKEIRWK